MKAAEYWKRRTVDLEHLLQARTTATMVEVNRMYARVWIRSTHKLSVFSAGM